MPLDSTITTQESQTSSDFEPGSYEHLESQFIRDNTDYFEDGTIDVEASKKRMGANSRIKGNDFELMTKEFLEKAPRFDYEKVELWSDWIHTPVGKASGFEIQDLGTDIVATNRDGSVEAIQCKGFHQEATIAIEDISGFIAHTNSAEKVGFWNARLFFTSAKKISKPATHILKGGNASIEMIFREDLINTHGIEWTREIASLRVGIKAKKARSTRIIEGRPHQRQAISDIEACLWAQDKKGQPQVAQCIMACGTGKTVVAQMLAKKTLMEIQNRIKAGKDVTYLGDNVGDNSILVCLPSINLVRQTLDSFQDFDLNGFSFLAVCSDKDVGFEAQGDDADNSSDLSGLGATTDPDRVQQFLAGTHSGKYAANRPRIIFSTYHSSHIVAEAQKRLPDHQFAIAFGDEAHNLDGRLLSDNYASILDQSKIIAKKRVFLTATPKTNKWKDDELDHGVDIELDPFASMDNKEQFGPVAHTLTFRQAVKAKLIVDYEVIALGVHIDDANEYMEQYNSQYNDSIEQFRQLNGIDANTPVATENKRYLTQYDAAAKIALAQAITNQKNPMDKDQDPLNLKRVLTFHSRIANAEAFVGSNGNGTYKNTDKNNTGPVVTIANVMEELYGSSQNVTSECITSKTKSKNRAAILKAFQESSLDDPSVISSVNCLGEGIDIKNLNGAMIVDPRTSESDIAQIIGRVMRLASDGVSKEKGYILLPVILNGSLSIEEQMKDQSFDKVWKVMRALKGIDIDLDKEMHIARGRLTKSKPFQKKELDPIDAFRKLSIQEQKEREEYVKDIPIRFIECSPRLRAQMKRNQKERTILMKNLHSQLRLQVVDVCTSRILVDVSNLVELRGHIEAFRVDNGDKYPIASSGPIKGTDDTWSAVNERLRRLDTPSSLSQEVAKLNGVILTGIKVNESDPEELHGHIAAFKIEKGSDPKVSSGAIKGTDDTWSAVNARLRKLDTPSSLSQEVAKLTGGKVNESDPDELRRHIKAFSVANGGEYPTTRNSGAIKGMDDTWRAVAQRLGSLTPPSSLSKEIDKLNGAIKINESDPVELRTHIELFRENNKDEYPSQRSGGVKGKDDTWGGVDGRLRKLTPPSSLSQEVEKLKLISGKLTGVRVNESDSDDLRRYLEAFKTDNNGEYPIPKKSGAIKGTDDTWSSVNLRLGKLTPPSSLSQEITKLNGGKVNESDPDELREHLEVFREDPDNKDEYPNQRTKGNIKGTDDTWVAVNLRLGKLTPPRSLSQEVKKLQELNQATSHPQLNPALEANPAPATENEKSLEQVGNQVKEVVRARPKM